MRARLVMVMIAAAVVAGAWLLWGPERMVAPVAVPPVPASTPTFETKPEPAAAPVVVREPGRAAAAAPDDRVQRLIQDIERALRSFDAQERESIFSDLLPDLIARDAAAAGRLVESLEPGPARDQLREHVAQKWAERDPEGASRWVESLENDVERKLAAADIITQLARSDPAVAIEAADRFEVGHDDGRVAHLAQTWAEGDLPAALQWARTQPAGAARDRVLARIALVQAAHDPAQAASLVSTEMTPGPARQEAMLQIVRTWAARDIDGARQWVATFPPGELRRLGEAELARAVKTGQ